MLRHPLLKHMTNLEVVTLAEELAAGKRSIVAAAALAAAQLHAVLMTQDVATVRMHHTVKLVMTSLLACRR